MAMAQASAATAKDAGAAEAGFAKAKETNK